MMKRLAMFAATAAAMMCSTSSSFAADAAPTTIATNATSSGVAGVAPNDDPFYRRAVFTEYVPEKPSHPFRIGFGADIGVPSGFALGVVVHPTIDWVSLQASLTNNYVGWGGRLSAKLDPFAMRKRLAIGLFLDLQGGFAGQGSIPGHSDLPSFGYDYMNFYGGLRLGTPNGFHWNLEIGPTYMHVATSNFQSVVKNDNVVIGNPVVEGWVLPTFITGFEVVFP